jgi:hypothetical protein
MACGGVNLFGRRGGWDVYNFEGAGDSRGGTLYLGTGAIIGGSADLWRGHFVRRAGNRAGACHHKALREMRAAMAIEMTLASVMNLFSPL